MRKRIESHPDLAALSTRFGVLVKDYRRRLGISQEELAWRADVHRTYLADVERGGRNVSLTSIARLVNALGVSLSEFFGSFDKQAPAPAEAPAGDGSRAAVNQKKGVARKVRRSKVARRSRARAH